MPTSRSTEWSTGFSAYEHEKSRRFSRGFWLCCKRPVYPGLFHERMANQVHFPGKFCDIRVDTSFSLFPAKSRSRTGPKAGCQGFPSGCPSPAEILVRPGCRPPQNRERRICGTAHSGKRYNAARHPAPHRYPPAGSHRQTVPYSLAAPVP